MLTFEINQFPIALFQFIGLCPSLCHLPICITVNHAINIIETKCRSGSLPVSAMRAFLSGQVVIPLGKDHVLKSMVFFLLEVLWLGCKTGKHLLRRVGT